MFRGHVSSCSKACRAKSVTFLKRAASLVIKLYLNGISCNFTVSVRNATTWKEVHENFHQENRFTGIRHISSRHSELDSKFVRLSGALQNISNRYLGSAKFYTFPDRPRAFHGLLKYLPIASTDTHCIRLWTKRGNTDTDWRNAETLWQAWKKVDFPVSHLQRHMIPYALALMNWE